MEDECFTEELELPLRYVELVDEAAAAVSDDVALVDLTPRNGLVDLQHQS